MKYYISDLHLGHENIIKLCNRPFKSVEDMDRILIDNWNSVITPDDEVYILGDLVFRASNSPLDYFKKLNGKKYLIKGNHDNIRADWRPYFEWIRDYAEIKDNGKDVILFHYPIVEWNKFFRHSIHLYGHIHNSTNNQAYKILKKISNSYNVGADVIGFTPRTLDEVIKFNEEFNKTH
jgi:calcineurin-like phosphoesterase family protein